MAKIQLQTRAHSLVDDVVCQGVRYWFELGVLPDGRHAAAMIRSASADSRVLGGFYNSMERMVAQAPIDLREQGVPPSVVSYVQDSLRLLKVYR